MSALLSTVLLLWDLSPSLEGMWLAQEWPIFSWESWINTVLLKPKHCYRKAWPNKSSSVLWKGRTTRILAPVLLFIWNHLLSIVIRWDDRALLLQSRLTAPGSRAAAGLKGNGHTHVVCSSRSVQLLGKQQSVTHPYTYLNFAEVFL